MLICESVYGSIPQNFDYHILLATQWRSGCSALDEFRYSTKKTRMGAMGFDSRESSV